MRVSAEIEISSSFTKACPFTEIRSTDSLGDTQKPSFADPNSPGRTAEATQAFVEKEDT